MDLDLFLWGCLGFATGLVLFLPFYALRGMGAGDVKLMAACGLFLGPVAAAAAVAASLLAGLVVSLCYVMAVKFYRRIGRSSDSNVLLQSADDDVWKTRLPFAAAIATGTTCVVTH